jgi:hypothetical protein
MRLNLINWRDPPAASTFRNAMYERINSMAQGQRNGNGNPNGTPEGTPEYKPLASLTPEIWSAACAAAGFTVNGNNEAVIGISGDSGDGYLVAIPAPMAIDMGNLVRACLGHALRVGQSGVKASKAPNREVATTSANSAMNGGYKPSRERSNDIALSEAERLFEVHVGNLVRQAKPDASEDDIAATHKKQAASDGGKAWIAAKKAEVLANGTYAVNRKGKGTGAEVAITL